MREGGERGGESERARKGGREGERESTLKEFNTVKRISNK